MINEPIPLDYYQLKMQFTFILFDSVLYNFMGFDKCINRVHHYNITQKTFASKNYSVLHLIKHLLPLDLWKLPIFLQSL